MGKQALTATSSSMGSTRTMGAGAMESGSMGLNSMEGSMTWIVIAAILAVVLGIILYFTFLKKKNDGKFTGFLGWFYDFLNFKKLTIEAILKITYLMLTLFITLGSFAIISYSFLAFLLVLLLGNLVLRLIYEFSLITILICRNTTEINSKLNKKDE